MRRLFAPMRFLRRPSRRPLILSSVVLCAIAGGVWFQIARRAEAQLGGPIAPSLQNSAPRAAPPRAATAPDLSPVVIAPLPTIAAVAQKNPTALPAPPPIPASQLVRVGLSTEQGTLSIWSAGGLILRDLRQPARALRSGPNEIVKFNRGAPVNVRSGAMVFRGTISLDINGRKSTAWQYISVAVPGDENARVTSNGKSARWGRPYRGGFEIFPQQMAEPDHRKNALSLVNLVDMEDYLKGVVPWEMDASAPLEALKAQAMCARSETLNFKATKRFAAGKFDICDYDACQGYPGTENEKPQTSRAVEETRGLTLFSGGRVADAVYSTNSGGISSKAADVWKTSSSIPYLQSIRDFAPDSPLASIVKPSMSENDWRAYCSQSWPSFARPSDADRANLARRRAANARVAALYGPDDEPEFYRWKRFISVKDALSAFAAKGFAQVTNFEVAQRTDSGHIRQLRIVGVAANGAPANLTLVGDSAIRAMFSGRMGSTTALPSSTFVISPQAGADGKLAGWQIFGAGWGHGVGMCQRGAQNHALAGWDARRIVSWYFQGAEVRKLY